MENRSLLRPGFTLRPSADLAGRAVGLSADVPVVFDVPLAPHHKLIGRWAARQEKSSRRYTRHEARIRIEKVFEKAVLEILKPVEIADLRAVVLNGDDERPPAIALVCDSIGQIDLNWIEDNNVLANTLTKRVAPVGWQAAAYRALLDTLPRALPVFNYEDLFQEMSAYYWDGAEDDETAKRFLADYHGYDEEDVAGFTLPSEMNAKRPAWMLPENADPLKQLPKGLADRIRRLRETHKAFSREADEGNAWHFDTDVIFDYLPDQQDTATLPPMTLVPAEHFAQELDDVGQHAMELGFMDITGICPLTDVAMVDDWFTSLKRGVDFLLAAQALIEIDPTTE